MCQRHVKKPLDEKIIQSLNDRLKSATVVSISVAEQSAASTDLSETDLRIIKCLLLSGARIEISLLSNRADYDKVALECFCNNCERLIYIGLDLRDYRKSVVDSYSEQVRAISGKCPECKTDSLIIPIV